VATGEAYDATLTLHPAGGGDPVELARGVGSFALSPDGGRLAWAEPTPTERDGDTELVEVAFPSGDVLHTPTFSGFPFPDVDPPGGFADVVAYVGDKVLLMTGDGAVATAAVWIPATGEVTMAAGYASVHTGNSSGNQVVLSQGDGPCGVIASVGDDGSVTPPSSGIVNKSLDCWANWAPTFSPDGAVIASAGTDGETGPPILLFTSVEGVELARLPINDVAGQYFQPHTIRWLDNETLLLLASSFDSSRTDYWDEEWGIWRCHTDQSECNLAQAVAFSPTGDHQVALVDGAK
jgi:WD40 repeat protein